MEIGYLTHDRTVYVCSYVNDKGEVTYGASTVKGKALSYAKSGVPQAMVGRPDWLFPIGGVCPKEGFVNESKLLLGSTGILKQYLPDSIRYNNTIAPVINGDKVCLILLNDYNVTYIHGDDLIQCCLQAVIEHHKNIGIEFKVTLPDIKRRVWLAKWLTKISRINLHEII